MPDPRENPQEHPHLQRLPETAPFGTEPWEPAGSKVPGFDFLTLPCSLGWSHERCNLLYMLIVCPVGGLGGPRSKRCSPLKSTSVHHIPAWRPCHLPVFQVSLLIIFKINFILIFSTHFYSNIFCYYVP